MDDEMRKKGEWAETAEEGIVPDELGDGDDASRVVGRTAQSDEPATDEGVDLSAGDNADAVRDGGPRRVDVDSAR